MICIFYCRIIARQILSYSCHGIKFEMSIFCKFSFPTFKSFNNWHFTQHLIYFFVFGNRVAFLMITRVEYYALLLMNIIVLGCYTFALMFSHPLIIGQVTSHFQFKALSVFMYLIALTVTPCRSRHALACILSPWTFNVHCARAKWWDPGKVKDNTCHRFTLKSLWIFVLNQCIIAKFLSTLLIYLSLTNHRVLKLLSYTVNKRMLINDLISVWWSHITRLKISLKTEGSGAQHVGFPVV